MIAKMPSGSLHVNNDRISLEVESQKKIEKNSWANAPDLCSYEGGWESEDSNYNSDTPIVLDDILLGLIRKSGVCIGIDSGSRRGIDENAKREAEVLAKLAESFGDLSLAKEYREGKKFFIGPGGP